LGESSSRDRGATLGVGPRIGGFGLLEIWNGFDGDTICSLMACNHLSRSIMGNTSSFVPTIIGPFPALCYVRLAHRWRSPSIGVVALAWQRAAQEREEARERERRELAIDRCRCPGMTARSTGARGGQRERGESCCYSYCADR
jgi:hypothetical protein